MCVAFCVLRGKYRRFVDIACTGCVALFSPRSEASRHSASQRVKLTVRLGRPLLVVQSRLRRAGERALCGFAYARLGPSHFELCFAAHHGPVRQSNGLLANELSGLAFRKSRARLTASQGQPKLGRIRTLGGVAEWSKAPDLKSGERATVPGVRIPSPPLNCLHARPAGGRGGQTALSRHAGCVARVADMRVGTHKH